MTMLHVMVTWHCCMWRSHDSAACDGHMTMLHVTVTWQCCMWQSNDNAACDSHMTMLHVTVTWQCCMWYDMIVTLLPVRHHKSVTSKGNNHQEKNATECWC